MKVLRSLSLADCGTSVMKGTQYRSGRQCICPRCSNSRTTLSWHLGKIVALPGVQGREPDGWLALPKSGIRKIGGLYLRVYLAQ